MKLKKAEEWVYNRSERDIIIDELGITVRRHHAVDIFALNPGLMYSKYKHSETEGVLAKKLNEKALVKLEAAPGAIGLPTARYQETNAPVRRKPRSAVGIKKKERDYLAEMQEEFAPNTSEQQLIQLEREKMLQQLNKAKQGEEGEVFADDMFEELDV